jgi:peptidoglycan-N-acetylglucosamine deacetylase
MISQTRGIPRRSVVGGPGERAPAGRELADAADNRSKRHHLRGFSVMDEVNAASRERPAPAVQRSTSTSGGRQLPPSVHRRRRVAALLAIGAAALIIGVVVGAMSGAGGHAPTKVASIAYFGQIRTLAGSGPTSFATTERAAENAAITRTMAYTPWIRIAGAQHREIALTFDDGPGPYTPQVLHVLEREHVPGTFFEVGVAEQYFHVSTSAIVARGYPIGDHTENHYAMSTLSRQQQQQQLLEESAAIGRYGAPFPRLFRPPYGLWNSTTLSLLKKYRMLMVLWTVDTNDYELPGVNAIVHSALSGAQPGAIILMHDAGGNRSETVAALPKIIAGLRKRGYTLVTVPQLVLDNPPPHDQDVAGLRGAAG